VGSGARTAAGRAGTPAAAATADAVTAA